MPAPSALGVLVAAAQTPVTMREQAVDAHRAKLAAAGKPIEEAAAARVGVAAAARVVEAAAARVGGAAAARVGWAAAAMEPAELPAS